MAKDNSTSKGGSRRARPEPRMKRGTGTPTAKRAAASIPEPSPFGDFGGERSTLMKAEAVLACLSVSLNYYGWNADDGTMYAMAVDVVRELVQQSMDRLERRDHQIETGKPRSN